MSFQQSQEIILKKKKKVGEQAESKTKGCGKSKDSNVKGHLQKVQ